jgi:serine/threonine protein kinase
LDHFCVAVTILVSVQENHRVWIGSDSLNEACSITIARLEKAFQLRPGLDFIFEDQKQLEDYFPPHPPLVVSGNRLTDAGSKQENILTMPSDSHDSGELSEALRFAIENKFPYPIAKPFEQLRAFDDWRAEIPQLANIVGASIEYLAIIALAEYGALEEKDVALSEAFLTDFKRPLSYGGWAGVLRRILSYMRNQGRDISVSEFLTLYFSTLGSNTPSLEVRINELVQLRNEIVKRAAERLPSRTEHLRLKKTLVAFLRELSFLKDYPLVTVLSSSTEAGIKWHNCYLHKGAREMFEKVRVECDLDIERNRVALLNFAKGELIYLHPFYLLRECPQCSVVHLFRFDRLDGKRAEYIGPDGHNFRDEHVRSDLLDIVGGLSSSGFKKKARYLASELSTTFMPAPAPTRLGKYRVVSAIRVGGMADIYKVAVAGTNDLFALKLLPYQFFRDPTVIRRFRQEAKHIRSLSHPNIVHVFDYGEDLSEHYLVMELAPGWNFNEIDNALDVSELPKPLPENTGLSIIKQACEGLDYIHQHRIIHRDVKPANLLLFTEGRVKLSDFGIARSAESITLTMTGLNVGTPEYSSPEQADGRHDLTFASDIYSLGVVMFELLTGTSPFKRATPMASLMAHLKDPVPNPTSLRKDIPKTLASIVMKCLQKDATGRYQSARALSYALDDYERSRTIKAAEVEEADFSVAIEADSSSPKRTPTNPPTSVPQGKSIIYLNNCLGRDHVRLFGKGAFYDLSTTGFQSTKARNLRFGQECIVATRGHDDEIVFSWFSFVREDVKRDDTGRPCRVFFGEFNRSEKYPKAEAVRKEPYSAFFDIHGNFKRHSVIESASMPGTDLVRLIDSIGKNIFITYYAQFADRTLSNKDVVDLLPAEYTLKSRKSRTAHARRIFREGLEREALELISHSDNVGFEVASEADELLDEIRGTQGQDTNSRRRSITTEEKFFEELHRRWPAEAGVAKRILDWSLKNFSRVNWRRTSFVPVLEYGGDFSHNPITVYALGKVPRVGIKFGRMKKRNGLPKEKRMELLHRLNNIPGVRLPADSVDKYPNILLSTLANDDALEQFLQTITWTNDEVKAIQK